MLLTTYDIVRNNSKSLCGDNYFHDDRNEDGLTWDYMILDEVNLKFYMWFNYSNILIYVKQCQVANTSLG